MEHLHFLSMESKLLIEASFAYKFGCFFYLAPFMYTHNVDHRSNFGNDFFRLISLQETETYQKVLHLLQTWHDSMLPFKLDSFVVDSCGRLVYLSYSICNLKNLPKMRF